MREPGNINEQFRISQLSTKNILLKILSKTLYSIRIVSCNSTASCKALLKVELSRIILTLLHHRFLINFLQINKANITIQIKWYLCGH